MLKDRDIAQAQQQARQRGDSLRNKEERIALLDKKSELQQVLLDQTRTTRNIIIIGSVLAVLLFWVIYYQKQRSNGQLKKQQELIKNKNETLEKLLSEKEWLLKEVHHRVKNNLQVVMSLLNIQSFYLQDDNAISAIRDSQRRVNAISLIHKKLYLSDNPALVDMQLYIKELVDHLREYADDRRGITFGLSIDPISLDVGQALPVGLILNEAITNAFKYAFTVGNSGKIQVVLKNGPEEGWLTLLVADNGIGMDQASSAMQDSLGMNLMKGLAKDMDGTLVLQNQDGLSITVMFPAETEVRHHAKSSEIIQA
ncbi:sensor histidine kinase [Chitinophaga sedimenti]|uniref:sensor histidine kinase n=1 Tax=Chitinophaga sedimenti TaxID=2033606 RepID=UPI002006331E|nr:sensor histidine kinase [Chitinophaga sedimenti]MCK7554298.1 sensor histidine kinase [Chitinophaga sedimenti]